MSNFHFDQSLKLPAKFSGEVQNDLSEGAHLPSKSGRVLMVYSFQNVYIGTIKGFNLNTINVLLFTFCWQYSDINIR